MSEVGGLSDVGHLTPEVVVALVDGELSSGAEHRARVHLVHCVECRHEVRAHREAAVRVRDGIPMDQVHISGSLLRRLNRIPDDCAGGLGSPGDRHAAADGPLQSGQDVGINGCRRPDSLSGRMAAAARKVQRRTAGGRPKSPRSRGEG